MASFDSESQPGTLHSVMKRVGAGHSCLLELEAILYLCPKMYGRARGQQHLADITT